MSNNCFRSQYLSNQYNLPEFVKNSPHYHELFDKEIEIVKNNKGKWGLKYENQDGSIEYDYDTFFEAYFDSDKDDKRCIWFSDEIAHEIFGVDNRDKEGSLNENSNIGDIFFGRKCKHGYRMISRHRGDDTVKRLVSDYERWLEKDKDINENSFTLENLTEVYDWLTTHPDFWIEQEMGRHYSWNTEAGIISTRARPVRIDPKTNECICEYDPDYKTKPSVTEWWIEGGLHVINKDSEDDYCTEHYHDLVLDDAGSTYDEALVKFAKNVWLQSQGRLKDREDKRDKYLDNLLKEASD